MKDLHRHLTAAWQGRISGCQLGKAVEVFSMRQGQVVSRTEIEQHLYDENKDLMSNTVDSCVSAIRKKLKAAGSPDPIQTRRGQGYVLGKTAS